MALIGRHKVQLTVLVLAIVPARRLGEACDSQHFESVEYQIIVSFKSQSLTVLAEGRGTKLTI